MATQTQVIGGNRVGLVGQLTAGRSRISESFTEFFVSGLVEAWEELTSYFLIIGRSVLSGISEESIKKFDIDCAKFNGR